MDGISTELVISTLLSGCIALAVAVRTRDLRATDMRFRLADEEGGRLLKTALKHEALLKRIEDQLNETRARVSTTENETARLYQTIGSISNKLDTITDTVAGINTQLYSLNQILKNNGTIK